MSDGITDAARQTERALKQFREKLMAEEQEPVKAGRGVASRIIPSTKGGAR